jgi:hypothetical protein
MASTVRYEMVYWLEEQEEYSYKGLWIVRTRDGQPCTPDNSRVFTVEEFLND